MPQDRKNLEKLVKFIEEVANEEGNEWFREKLQITFSKRNSALADTNCIDEIYEYCIQLIIREHAEKFYSDFKLLEIKDSLISDFIRMEQYRRENNFEDFCLATFQQFENIVNSLCKEDTLLKHLITEKSFPAILKYDSVAKTFIRKGDKTVAGLIFQTSDMKKIDNILARSPNLWFFNHRYRAVLYLYYFKSEIKGTLDNFERVYEVGNYLYQGRNMNHRGTPQSFYQQSILDTIIPNQHKYYFKFLGFLEDFVTVINANVEPHEHIQPLQAP